MNPPTGPLSVKKPVRKYHLTVRQMEIMDLIIKEHLEPKELAERLCLATSTIHYHLDEIRAVYESVYMVAVALMYQRETLE